MGLWPGRERGVMYSLQNVYMISELGEKLGEYNKWKLAFSVGEISEGIHKKGVLELKS